MQVEDKYKTRTNEDLLFFFWCKRHEGTKHAVARSRHSCGNSDLKLSKLHAAHHVDDTIYSVAVYHIDGALYHVAVYRVHVFTMVVIYKLMHAIVLAVVHAGKGVHIYACMY